MPPKKAAKPSKTEVAKKQKVRLNPHYDITPASSFVNQDVISYVKFAYPVIRKAISQLSRVISYAGSR